MKIKHIFENEVTDSHYRQEALKVYKRIVKGFTDNAVKRVNFGNLFMKGEPYSLPFMRYFNSRIGVDYKNLIIVIHGLSGAARGSYGRLNRNGRTYHIIQLFGKGINEPIPEFLRRQKSVVIHELIHLLDRVRYKGNPTGSFEGRGISKSDYYNNPSEYNAYYQQAIHEFDSHINRLARDARVSNYYKQELIDTLHDYFESGFPGFYKEFRDNNLDKGFVSHMTQSTENRLKKRLYDYYRKRYLNGDVDKIIQKLS